MRLKAPANAGGDPCVAGVTIRAKSGIYEVDEMTGRLLVDSFGFVDADAPAQKAKPQTKPDTVLRPAIVTSLKSFGIALTDGADDATLAAAINQAAKIHTDLVAQHETATKQLSAEVARAEAAEKATADLLAKLDSTDTAGNASTTTADSAKAAATDPAKKGGTQNAAS